MLKKLINRLPEYLIIVFLLLVAVAMLLPLLTVLATSFSSSIAVEAGKVTIFPVEFTLASWEQILQKSALWKSLGITVLATVIGTTLALAVTALLAYPLSKRNFMPAKILTIFVVLTMIFKAPIVPYFLTIKALGLMDSFWVLVIPHMVLAYNMVIMKSFFSAVPLELEESAKMDGAGHFKTFIHIILPVSKPVMATLGLFYSVLIWNQFMHPILFIQSQHLFPLQLRLRMYISQGEDLVAQSLKGLMPYNSTTLTAAAIIFGVIPILMVYPYIQKYFVKGAMLGSTKG